LIFRRSHAAARHVRAGHTAHWLTQPRFYVTAAAAAAADDAAVYRQSDDYKLIIID